MTVGLGDPLETSCCLSITGLAEDATQREIHILFSACVGFLRCQLKSTGGLNTDGLPCAVVHFDEKQHAQLAARARLGTTWFEGGDPINIDVIQLADLDVGDEAKDAANVAPLVFGHCCAEVQAKDDHPAETRVVGVEAIQLGTDKCPKEGDAEVGGALLDRDTLQENKCGQHEELARAADVLLASTKFNTKGSAVATSDSNIKAPSFPPAGDLAEETSSPSPSSPCWGSFWNALHEDTRSPPGSPGVQGQRRLMDVVQSLAEAPRRPVEANTAKLTNAHLRVKAAIAGKKISDLETTIQEVSDLGLDVPELNHELDHARELLATMKKKVEHQKVGYAQSRALTQVKEIHALVCRQDVIVEQKSARLGSVTRSAEEAVDLCFAAGLRDSAMRIEKALRGAQEAWRSVARTRLAAALDAGDKVEIAGACCEAEYAGMGLEDAPERDIILLQQGHSALERIDQKMKARVALEEAIDSENIAALKPAVSFGEDAGVEHRLVAEASRLLDTLQQKAVGRWMLLAAVAVTKLERCDVFEELVVLERAVTVLRIGHQFHLTEDDLCRFGRSVRHLQTQMELNKALRLAETLGEAGLPGLEQMVAKAAEVLPENHEQLQRAASWIAEREQIMKARVEIQSAVASKRVTLLISELPNKIATGRQMGVEEEDINHASQEYERAVAQGKLQNATKQRDMDAIKQMLEDCKRKRVDPQVINAAMTALVEDEIINTMDEAVEKGDIQRLQEAINVWRAHGLDRETLLDAEASLQDLKNRAIAVKAQLEQVLRTPIGFETDSAVLLPEAKQVLAQAIKCLKEFPMVAVEIHGHSVREGASEAISQQRAERVKTALMLAGCENPMSVRAWGVSHPDVKRECVRIFPRWAPSRSASDFSTSSVAVESVARTPAAKQGARRASQSSLSSFSAASSARLPSSRRSSSIGMR